MKVVITDWNFPNIDVEREIIEGAGHTVVDAQCKTEEEVATLVKDADVVIAQWAPVKAAAIAAMTQCKGIVRYGIGLDNIDLTAAKDKDIPVANVPDYCLNEVADHTVALMLAAQRQILSTWDRINQGTWVITSPQTLPPLRQSTLALIGLGRISQRVASRAQAFGMTVIAYDPGLSEEQFAELGVASATLEEIWESADVVSLHCPLVPATHHLINAEVLAKMKATSIVVNTSRGGLVSTNDLMDALNNGVIGGAALDVVEEEPLSNDHPLLKAKNLVVTSHTAWHSGSSITELQTLAAQKAVELLTV
ncbi:C-terminal binding protein [Reichenbachiella carrageenanivorans]|uniref:C-terminal binding protein n=1 Tax=Reichenbachiella carrageenanivorans TaxID=2979869 RepID=A0ABY6D140_9BACT|nr:C-terminal binding protein [Reichenbachiella carrageenanivorans]UXX79889.1 C-terminal binding protein [Reichenbachiella carrageenanivorans]